MAAVALPQYQVAVKKSRYLQMIALGDAVHKAEELYWLANGKYTSDITQLDLDVSVPRQPMQGFSINPTDPSVWMGMAGLPRYVAFI